MLSREKSSSIRHPAYGGLRLGVDLPGERSVPEQAEFAAWAEERGFDDAWTAEIAQRDPFVVLAAAATKTSTIRLGTSIVPVGPRTMPALAMSAAAIAELCPARFVLGIGASTPTIIGDWHGLEFGRPRERMGEALTLLRALLEGERTAFAGQQLRSHNFKLRPSPAEAPPIAVAAMNRLMLETAGQLADAVFLNFVPVERLGQVVEAVGRGVERAGRDQLPELLIAIPCEVTEDVGPVREAFGRTLAFYLTAPVYRSALRWYGFEEDIDRAEEAWGEGDFERLRAAVSDRLIDELGAFGTAASCRERIAAYGAAGVGAVSISASGENGRATLEALAPVCQSEGASF